MEPEFIWMYYNIEEITKEWIARKTAQMKLESAIWALYTSLGWDVSDICFGPRRQLNYWEWREISIFVMKLEMGLI